MKKILLSLVAIIAMTSLAFAQGKADFSTLSTNTSYGSRTTTNGWEGTNCAVFQGGSTDSSPTFMFISSGEKAMCMNGKTSAVGTITSPTLEGGIGTLTFNFGHPFSDSKGVNITISVKQSGTVVATTDLIQTSVTQKTAYEFEYEFNVSGDFVIELKNNSPSNSNSNKDRVAIWNLEWTGYTSNTTPKTAAPTITPNGGTISSNTEITITAEEGADIYYTIDGENPTTESPKYSGAFTLSNDATVKAIAVKTDYENSFVVSAKFIIEKNFGYVTKVTSGKKYLIVAERWITPDSGDPYISSVMATPLSGNFGYIYVEDATQENGYIKLTSYVNAFTITETEGGYTIQDSNGKYLYQTDTYNSFNVSTDLPETGVVWTIEPTNDNTGSMTITNTSVNKWIQYSTGYSSFGSYDSLQANAVLPRLYEESATAEDDVLTGIEDAMIDADAPVEYYNLQGVKVANPENGIFIKRQGGKAIKVVL